MIYDTTSEVTSLWKCPIRVKVISSVEVQLLLLCLPWETILMNSDNEWCWYDSQFCLPSRSMTVFLSSETLNLFRGLTIHQISSRGTPCLWIQNKVVTPLLDSVGLRKACNKAGSGKSLRGHISLADCGTTKFWNMNFCNSVDQLWIMYMNKCAICVPEVLETWIPSHSVAFRYRATVEVDDKLRSRIILEHGEHVLPTMTIQHGPDRPRW